MRIETDYLGNRELPDDAMYGIHSLRASENFPDQTPFHKEWYKAVGHVKKACYLTYAGYKKALTEKYDIKKIPFPLIPDEVIQALLKSAEEISKGDHFENFIVPAIQGGAGTSINMNINEIIANTALIKCSKKTGQYNMIDPVEQANIYQSTNDVIPTALKLAAVLLLRDLEDSINILRKGIEQLENKYRDGLRVAYTQMQEAVPSSYGRLFSTYNEALSRDWWRISKCFERIKQVNLGGSAVGTGISVPTYFLMEVVQTLQKITNTHLTKSENLSDATCNLDSFVEVHAMIKAHAVNLEKMVSDFRLLSSDLYGKKELSIPKKQVGSSIMPGKINPVIPEFIVSVAHKVYANDVLISSLCAQGTLDLNAYIPVIGHAFLESIKLLIAADHSLFENMISGIEVNMDVAKEKLFESPSVTTALLPYIGYNKASLLAKEMKEKKMDVFQANIILKMIDQNKLTDLLQPQNLLKEGFSINDIL